jgi:Tfp pilus assembly PilM family ATPase
VAFGFDKLAGLNPFAGGGLVSIDFGSQLLKVLQVTPGEPAQLVAAACVQTPPELMHDAAKRLEFQCEQLPTVIKAGGFKGRRGVCSLPVSQMFCKHMQVAVEAGGSVTEAAAAMAAGQLGVEPDVLAVRAIEVSDAVVPGGSAGNGGGPKREVIALATAKSLVDRVMEALRTAKLEPVGLQSEFQAIVAGFRPVNRRTQDIDVTSLYLDIGAGATKIVIGHGTKLAFAKAIGIGGRFIDQVAAHQAGCSVAEARTLRLGMQTLQRGGTGGAVVETEGGGGAATMVAQSAKASVIDLAEPLRALTDEINLSVRYHQELFPKRQIDRLIFVGGESRHAALCQHIARQFSFPAHTSDPLARIARTGSEPCNGVDIAQPQPGWAVPLGLLLAPTDV